MSRLRKLMTSGAAALLLGGCASWQGHRAAMPNPCRDMTVSIYFRRDSAAITREARAVLRGAGQLARGCVLGQVDVTGLADSIGDADVNLALSRRRAEAVRGAVERMGFTTVNFNVGAVGERGATTASGDNRPLRRQAEVTFHLRPY